MDDGGFSAAVEYYGRIMTADDVQMVKRLFRRIPQAQQKARQYLQKHCHTVKELTEFFEENSHCFFVENGRVALHDEELENASRLAELYFKEVLEGYKNPVHFMQLKKKHLGRAPEEVQNFITRFYPVEEFKHFIKSRHDTFVLDKSHKVFLIETESVAYFERRLELFGRENYNFLDFRGNIGHAPPHIQKYMNRNYWGDDFQDFLRNHSDVFQLDENMCVSLVPFKE